MATKNFVPRGNNEGKLGTFVYRWNEVHSDKIYIGDGTNTGDKYLYADNGNTNKPFIRYNVTSSNWEFSNNGTNFIPLQLKIQHDGVDVGTPVNILNFIGTNFTIEQVAGQEYKSMNISVSGSTPPSGTLPFFNQTGALVPDITTYERYVSSPTTEGDPFKIGNWTAGTIHNTINTNNIIYNIPTFSCLNNSTTFTINVFDADGTTSLAQTSFTIDSNKEVNANNINVIISNFGADDTKYKCSMAVTININAIISNGGRFSISMVHSNGTDGTFNKTQNDIFYDSNNNLASCGAPTITENSGAVSTNALSGVLYYNLGSSFNLSIPNITNINDRSYPENVIELEAPDYGINSKLIKTNELSSWTNKFNSSATYSTSALNIDTPNVFNISPSNPTVTTKVRVKDWADGSWVDGSPVKTCINTLTDSSTNKNIFEDFITEENRVVDTSNGTTAVAWNSNTLLSTVQGLQVAYNRLIYPNLDLSTYMPSGNPNYSGCTGSRSYIRRFWQTNQDNINMTLKLTDFNVTEADITNGDIIIEVSGNGTIWFKCTSPYEDLGLSFTDPDYNGFGCRVNWDTNNLSNPNDARIACTFGGAYTAADTGGGWGVYLKITYADTTRGKELYIGSIQIMNWV